MTKISPYIFNTYKRQPLRFVRGQGAYLWTDRGEKYLDFFSGLAVCGVGHANPQVAAAVARQAKELIHTSNLYFTVPQEKLAERLSKRTFGGKVFFSNSGAEANECAIKLARRFGHVHNRKGKDRYEIVVFENSFHGRTMATLSATAQKKYQKGFGPLLPGFRTAKRMDLASVKKCLTPRTCAVLIEPIQGEGGVRPADRRFLALLKALCRRHDLLLMFDEVQTGIGRTGYLYAYQCLDVIPDVLTSAKGLADGIPIGATLAKPAVADLLKPGDHASTFGGGPVVCAAALAVLDILTPAYLKRIRQTGEEISRRLMEMRSRNPVITDVRGRGLMWGVQLDRPGDAVVPFCRENGLLVNCTAGNVIRLLPPFCVGKKEIDRAMDLIEKAIFSLTTIKKNL
ncbi:MAG TPA: aspartate aminotransferase family protein [Elusimicrobiota bacterium]|nr:aspartate aminotransferase family protein [Elusimicrobiota bacterium]